MSEEKQQLTREEILAKSGQRTVRSLNGWTLQSLNGLEKISVSNAVRRERERLKLKPNEDAPLEDYILLTHMIVDAEGERMFKVSDAEALAQLDVVETKPIIDLAYILAGYSTTNVDKYLKNFEPQEDTN
jgi:hypothetical protein